MAATIHVLNGPNLNLLGEREPEVYGRDTLADIEALCRAELAGTGIDLAFAQSNDEADLVNWVQAARASAGIVINPAAYSYSGYAILDALKLCACPIVEVHLSNIHRREEWRSRSLISQAASGVISGLGPAGYALAVRRLAQLHAAG